MKNEIRVSVIIPVFNSESFLPVFFESYGQQTILNENFELILIDNGSTDNSKSIILKYIKMNPEINISYYFFDEIPDSYASRNYGVKNSKGELLVFTDSDCIPEMNWLEQICKNSREGIVISGDVEIQVIDKNNIWEIFDSFAHLNNKENADKGKVATANLAVMKSDFMKVGYFEERFSGGDHEWSQRAFNHGLQIKFYEEVKVLHPSRKKFKEILQKSKRMAYGQGVHYRIKQKSILALGLRFILKVFNIKTNIRYSRLLYKRGINITSVLKFNYYFFMMRFFQLKSSIAGYRNIDARSLNIK